MKRIVFKDSRWQHDGRPRRGHKLYTPSSSRAEEGLVKRMIKLCHKREVYFECEGRIDMFVGYENGKSLLWQKGIHLPTP